MLSSCCYNNEDVTSNDVFLSFTDYTVIDKIEFVGANNTSSIQSTEAKVTLNPDDTVCSYRIFYKGGNGVVSLSYKPKMRYTSVSCGDNLEITYSVKVQSTTFTAANLVPSYSNYVYVQITR